MTNLSLRLYMLLCLLATRVGLWAQGDDDDIIVPTRRRDFGETAEDMMVDYVQIHISFTDVLVLVFLLVCCYIFGKIWKGCTYILLVFAAILFYLSRF